jgi:signal transduction histidine kinase
VGSVTADRVVLALAAVVLVIAAVGTDEPTVDVPRSLDGWAAALVLLGVAVLVVGAARPAVAAPVVLGVAFVWYGAGYTSGLINAVTVVAYYRLGRSDGAGPKVAVTVASTVAVVANMVAFGGETWWSAVSAAGYLVMSVLFGELVRNRALLVEQYAARAERAEAEAERRVAEERVAIARDVHDLLAHTVSVMTVQAGVAADALDRDPAVTRRALAAIRAAGREATGEVQATVAVLRGGGAPTGTAPVPRLDRLDELLDAVRGHGVDVELDRDLRDGDLPELVELTAYRVVQEALTNVVRHAGASAVRVAVRDDPDALAVEVADDGAGADRGASAGFGLRGMAERVEAVGGSVHHGPAEGGGWVVRAVLPVARTPAT